MRLSLSLTLSSAHASFRQDPALVDLVPLDRLYAGQSARVVFIEGQPALVHRLAEFGLRKGTRIEMFQTGNPCILRLAGNKVCLRPDDRVRILVTPLDPSPC